MLELKVPISADEIIEAVKRVKKTQRGFLEDFLALTSPDYLYSILETREEYKTGKTKSHNEIFGK